MLLRLRLAESNALRQSPRVRLWLNRCRPARLRAVTAAFLFCAVMTAIGLSAAPQLHQSLHQIGDRPNHECAATLLSSGNVEDSMCEPAATEPEHVPSAPPFAARGAPRLTATFPSSLLEHGPPARS